MNTAQRGDQAKANIIAALLGAGCSILLPFSEAARYDLVIEDEAGRFSRVQCKSGWIKGGVILFHARSTRDNRDYRGAAEYFGVHCRETGKSYLVPVEAVGRATGTLRLDPPRNNQSKLVRMADDFEIKRP